MSKKRCGRCSGTGKHDCVGCEGNRKVYDSVKKAFAICNGCNGSGKVTCRQCNGSGEI
tara:strand:+ start:550 stop:723 length:174 start_codon:yes stop_codon:yes gene_type:complete